MKRISILLSLLFLAFLFNNCSLKAQSTYDITGTFPVANGSFLQSSNTTTGFTNHHPYNAGIGSSDNSWSTPYALPFAFDFYGTAVTHFIVSKNFLLSFDTSLTGTTVNALLNDNSALPNASLPNNTIAYYWDNFANGGSMGTNDDVWVGVFGTAPNRQLWVRHWSYATGGRSFSYNNLVLEETSNKIYMLESYSSAAGAGSMTIGAQLNATTAVSASGSPTITSATTSSTWANVTYWDFSPRVLTPNDASVSSIDAPSNPFSTGNQMVSVSLTNAGTSALTSATVNWAVNGVTQTPFAYAGSLASNATTSINLGMFNFTGISTIDAWTTNPNGLADGNPSNDSSTVTLYPAISGNYTLNSANPTAGTNFQSFGDLESALNLGGVNGPLNVSVSGGTFSEQFSLGKVLGSSSTNTIIIDGNGNSTITHDKSIRNSTITLEGTSYITIKNLSVAATGGTDSYGIHIWDSAHHVTIDSNTVSLAVGTTADMVGIMVSGSETSDNTGGDNAYDLVISNNTVTGGERGISVYGNFTASARNQNLTIHNNDIQNSDDNGLYITGYNNVTITDNYVFGLNNASSDGMYSSDLENFTITGNFFKGGDNGLEANDYNFDNTVVSRSLIANNMFIGGDDGLYLDDVEEIDIFHNSTHGNDYGVYINDPVNLDMRNNIFFGANNYAFYSLDNVAFTAIDYNIYNTGGTNLAYFGGSIYADLLAFQTGQATYNVNSIEGDPVYVNNTADLHSAGTLANDVGDNSAAITVDYDGETRPLAPATVVDIGADEFAPPTCPQPSALIETLTGFTSASLAWTENGTSTSWQIQWDTSGFTPGTGNFALTSTNPFAAAGLTAETNYDWYVRSICGAADTSAWSGPNSFYTGYCIPAPSSVDGQGIVNVSFDTVNNTTGVEPGNYGNYSNFIGNAAQGLSLPVDITYATGLTYLTEIYVDWNNDLDFNDPLENVYSGVSLGTNPTTLSASFTVPLATPLGQYRMRIGGADFSTPIPCYTGTWASFEDYTINVIAPPPCIAPSNLANTAVSADTARVNWTDINNATQWEIEWDLTGLVPGSGSNSAIVNVDTFFTITSLTASTGYDWAVRAICGPADTSSWSSVSSFTTNCLKVTSFPFVENFESPVTTNCWTNEYSSSTVDWQFINGNQNSSVSAFNGSGNAYFYSSNYNDDATYLVSPAMDLSSVTNPQMNFYHSQVDWGGDQDTLGVYYKTSAAGSWTYLTSFSSSITSWTLATVNLPNSSTDYYIGFLGYSGYGRGVTIDSLVIAPAPSCQIPTAVTASNVSTDTADISWTQGGSPLSWEIEYGPTGFTQGTGTTANATTNPYTLTSLSTSTGYDVYVRAICGPADTSAWSMSANFITTCAKVTSFPFIENFENPATNSCWTNEYSSSTVNWQFINGNQNASVSAFSGSSNAYFYSANYNGDATYMVSPAMDLSSVTNPQMTFYHSQVDWGGDQDTLGVYYKTSAAGSWTYLASFSNSIAAWTLATINLPNSSTDYYVGFLGYSGYGRGVTIDSLTIQPAPNCQIPTAITATSIGTDSAIIAWTQGGAALNWEIEYGVSGFTLGTGTSVIANSNPYNLNSLMAATAYDVYVRAICGPADSSGWSGVTSFSTLCIPFTAPYTESFNGTTMPSCWSQSAVQDGPWVFGTPGFTWNTQGCTFVPADNTGNSGNYAAMDFSGTGVVDVILEMPEVNVSALTTAYLEFYFVMCGIGYTPINILYIEAYDGTNWSSVDSIQRGTVGWEAFGYDVSSHVYNTNLVKLRFRASSAGNTVTMFLGDQAIDDVRIIEAPAGNLEAISIGRPDGGCNGGAADSVDFTFRNVGAAAQSNFPLLYELNGVAITPETYTGTINPGDTVTYTFATTANISASGVYAIKAYTNLATDFNPTNDTANKAVTVVGAGISSFPYVESFETGNGGWVANGNASWQLGAPAATIINSASSGSQAWVTNLSGNYPDAATGSIVSPCFDFTNVPYPYIELDINYAIETSWDGAVLQTSIDNGASWQIVGSVLDTVNWYNDSTIDALSANGVEPSEDGWSGTGAASSGGWIRAKHYLDGLAGQSSVQIRIAFATDGNTNAEGMGVDSIEVYNRQPVGIEKNDEVQASFSISPNPTNGQFTIRTNSLTSGNAELKVRDISGKVLIEERIISSGSNYTKTFDLDGNAKGIYFVTIIDGDQMIHEKLIKQ